MADSVYKVIRLVGSSPNSWEEAAKNAVETAGKSLRDLRVAEIQKLDLKVEDGNSRATHCLILGFCSIICTIFDALYPYLPGLGKPESRTFNGSSFRH